MGAHSEMAAICKPGRALASEPGHAGTLVSDFHLLPARAHLDCSHRGQPSIRRQEHIDIFPGNLDSSLCFIQPSISHDVLCIFA